MASKNIIKIGNIEIEQLSISEDLLNSTAPILIKADNGKYNNTTLVIKIDDLETTVTVDICGLPKNKVVIDNINFPGLQQYLQQQNLCDDFNEKIKCDQGIFDVVDISKMNDMIDLTAFFG